MAINETSTEFYVGKDLINTYSEEYKSITTSKKIAYTDGGELLYQGSFYTGYYNYTGGLFYKTKDKQEEELTLEENISTDIINSSKFKKV